MDRISANGYLMGMGLLLMIISPLIIAIYALLTATWAILGVILSSAGTLMFLNFYNTYTNKDNSHGDAFRGIGLLFGPLMVILGLYLMIKF